MQFCSNLQLLNLYSLFRNLPCSNLLAVDADRIFVTLDIVGVSRTIAFDILNVFWQDRESMLLVSCKKLSFTLFMVRCFFLLIHFLVVEGSELPKSASYSLSVPLNLECVRILSWFISFFSYFNCLLNDVLCKHICVTLQSELMIMLSNHHVTNLLACRNKFSFDLKNMKMQYQRYRKIQFCVQLYIDIKEIFYIYKLIHIDLRPRILIASFLLASYN